MKEIRDEVQMEGKGSEGRGTVRKRKGERMYGRGRKE